MAVSAVTLIALIFSTLIVLLAPFSVFLFGRKSGEKKISGFFSGILWFIIVFVVLTVVWSLFDMDNTIARFLGTDDTVQMIRQTIMYAVYAVIETLAFIFICRRFCKKGVDTPYKALRFAGGYAVPETIYVLLYLLLPLIVILTNGGTEFNIIGDTISLGSVSQAGVSEYLFKAWWRLLSLCIYCISMYLIYTGVRYDAKWFYFIVPFLNLGLDLPYTYTAINSRKWTADTVVVVNVYWKSERLSVILMTLTAMIALIICRVVYKNYYMPEEKRAALKVKKEARKAKRIEKKAAKAAIKDKE